jgi:hypothetical protein
MRAVRDIRGFVVVDGERADLMRKAARKGTC